MPTKRKKTRKKTHKKRNQKQTKNDKKFNIMNLVSIAGFILAVISICFTISFSNPVDLEISHNISNNSLTIYGKNNDWFRSTGSIDIYRIEVNPNKPFTQISGLGPQESKKLFQFKIKPAKTNEVSIYRKPLTVDYDFIYGFQNQISISYKIMCDKCKGQGIIAIVPNDHTHQLEFSLTLSNDSIPNVKNVTVSVPYYCWDVSTSDIFLVDD